MGEISKINMGGVDYDIRDKVLEEQLGNINAKPMISVTYAELVALRDNGELIAGMQYRITDFVTTTAQENTRSAGHQFDVIVTADNENTLNEVARACMHEGDTYFSEAGANLAAWQIWYSLDNDTQRFAWADAENGKGVIYRMIDEWNNDIPYDFKNIVYIFNKSFMYSQWGRDSEFIRNQSIDKVIDDIQYYGYITDNLPIAWPEGKCWVIDENVTANSQLYNEDGSAISYGGTIYNISNEEYESFTFNEGELNDFSLEGEFCYGNTIMPWTGGLNRIVFKNDKTYEYQGQYRHNCYGNSFGNECYNNSFGNDCSSNSFGNECYSNSFGNSCYNNSFGNNCNSNSFGYECSSNSFGNYCYNNSFGNNCNSNSFGNSCYNNSFGNNCNSNSFGYECSSNSFGNECYSNSFGNSCSSNSFGNDCSSNSFGNECYYNSFGNYCYYNSFGNYSQSNELKAYYRYITFGEGVQYVTLQNNTEGGYENLVQNYRVANGTHGEDGSPLVVDVTRNMGCETFIGMDSNDGLKVFCLADLLNS